MDSSRRRFLGRWGSAAAGAAAVPFALPRPEVPRSEVPRSEVPESQVRTDERFTHERYMRLAIEQARKNAYWPFGAVIVGTRSGEVLGSGVNTGADNPMFHGEVVAMNDYVRRNGNQGWADTTLYTTGEPCSMCMSAMAWADLRRVVWASSIDEIRRTDISQIALTAREVAAAARSLYTPELLLGGVLANRTNALFEEAQRLREQLLAAPSANVS
ncbi:nucleoside deaminase [Streptomyces sp. GQFP]|uniref:nucleoside deaminase n=1 Tax=Streptomyces sp. GQFP TaxID=2907545 RepID=UPI001F1C5197|nr:nucleoside deaminase [Streptomyces sp. GQFP]UIX33297.1 nucleoside deaminase [Streptomyces sp. GQFP]